GGVAAAPTENLLLNGHVTNARIALATPIASKATAKIEIEWNHKIPGATGNFSHRMSQRWGDTLYQPTQWYPRVAVYDDLRGWDAELYLGPSEFYNNFGRFDVAIDAPAGWIVSGTGVLQNSQDVLTPKARAQLAKVLSTDSNTVIVGPDEVGPGQATANGTNGRLVWRFHADTVNDFAWLTARKLNWTATRATIPTKNAVPINMYFQPGDARVYENAGPIARHALEFYSQLWFPYQFPQLTLQDGPSAGMEYPMVINSNQGAADHETGHQWWPMVVSNNETMYGWMDEGFNQYMNILSAADSRRQKPVLDGPGASYGSTSGNEAEPPMMWNANYAGPGMYGFQTYSKTPLMLSMLGGVVGDSAVQRAQREWGRAWMFKHPSPWDYMFS
ncbi:MAG: M1 family peptidase, partial [Gemmatimonadota bacterium]|nr:M1 family peptidase [Gemmatimonadota bacterium]